VAIDRRPTYRGAAQKKITYYEEDGLVYWTMGAPFDETTIINRCRNEDSFEYRSTNGTLPETTGA